MEARYRDDRRGRYDLTHQPAVTLSVQEIQVRMAQLTPGQLDCLLLVMKHESSKEIARQLGISPHTVDQRIRLALKTLGVRRRSEAARLLQIAFSEPIHPSPILPFATGRHSYNSMTLGWRLLWILIIAGGAAIAAGVVLAAGESVTALLHGH